MNTINASSCLARFFVLCMSVGLIAHAMPMSPTESDDNGSVMPKRGDPPYWNSGSWWIPDIDPITLPPTSTSTGAPSISTVCDMPWLANGGCATEDGSTHQDPYAPTAPVLIARSHVEAQPAVSPTGGPVISTICPFPWLANGGCYIDDGSTHKDPYATPAPVLIARGHVETQATPSPTEPVDYAVQYALQKPLRAREVQAADEAWPSFPPPAPLMARQDPYPYPRRVVDKRSGAGGNLDGLTIAIIVLGCVTAGLPLLVLLITRIYSHSYASKPENQYNQYRVVGDDGVVRVIKRPYGKLAEQMKAEKGDDAVEQYVREQLAKVPGKVRTVQEEPPVSSSAMDSSPAPGLAIMAMM